MKYLSVILFFIAFSASTFAQSIVTADNIFNYYLLEAVKAKSHGDYTTALSHYSNCYKLDNKSSLVMFEMSRIYYAAKKMDEANLWLDRAIQVDSTDNLSYIKYAATLKLYSAKYPQAKDYYKVLVKREPDVPTHKLMLARLYSQLNMPDSAHATLNQVSTDQVPWVSIQLEHADLFKHELNARKLEKTLKNIVKKEPNDPESYKYLADYYFAVKNPKKALKYLTDGLSKPGGDMLLFDLADYYFKNDQYNLFKSYADRAVVSVDIDPQQKSQALNAYVGQKDKELYLRKDSDYLANLISKAVSFHPDNEQLNVLLASYYSFTSRPDMALKVMDTYFATHTANYDFFATYIYSITSQPEMDWVKLNKVVSTAFELFPEEPYIVQAKVLCLNHFDDYSKSVDILSDYLSDFPDVKPNQKLRSIKLDFLNLLAESYYQMGRLDDCFATYDAVLSLEPNHIVALNNYAYYLSLIDKRLDDAERMSSKTISAEPQNPTYLDTYAWVLYKKGKYSNALLMMEAAINNSTEPSAELYEHYGRILKALNEDENAVIQFKKAYELDPGRKYLIPLMQDAK